MPKKKKRVTKKGIPEIKKEINDFLLSEEGKITKEDIAKYRHNFGSFKYCVSTS